MKPEITTLFNPVALNIPEVKAEMQLWSRMDGWYADLADRMTKGGAVVIVGTSDPHELEAVAIVTLPINMAEELPWVVHFHNRGKRTLTKLMIDAVVAFIEASGYTAYKALNQSGHKDKIWLRAFKLAGTPIFIGSTYLFNLKEEVSDGGNSVRGSRTGDRPKPVRKQRRKSAAKPAAKLRAKRPGKQSRGHDKARVRGARPDGRRPVGRPPRSR